MTNRSNGMKIKKIRQLDQVLKYIRIIYIITAVLNGDTGFNRE